MLLSILRMVHRLIVRSVSVNNKQNVNELMNAQSYIYATFRAKLGEEYAYAQKITFG